MNYKELGDTGIQIPEIGLGTWNYRGWVKPLQKGIELGATFIDTAEGYYTEDIVGQAIRGKRDKVFIATKVSGRHLAYREVLKSAEESLYKLGTDRIDLYQIHWPNPAYPLKETMRAMEKLADDGLIKNIGVSNFSLDEMKEAQYYLNNHKIVSNQVLYNLNHRDIEKVLIPYCNQNKITVIAYTPLDSGSLTKKGLLNNKSNGVLAEVAEDEGKTMSQVALNWCNSRPCVISIPKSDSVERTEENCGGSGWRLKEENIAKLDKAFGQQH
ncbi:MAG: aldo/keto reductase [Candidatus Dadabacteria bacterium]|nr:aldo/keto reductase [Candidatus Dadabacteria bacterium]NIS09736.1 aldo/keto reductase [Candidatus Dadabacteria bacterium]NIV41098.1 aldo/keto reductase [Candidatus Dadabacteria bacterium]NIX16194.1 aldo/keto reductase [Candidatus Dadabacteria bacterium]NIY22817.1 aldo/keto reductase [Candidatus Dadabacteria bacterium]